MTLADPLPDAAMDADDYLLPSSGQMALAEKRLAEMIADPTCREPLDDLLAYLASRA